MASSTQVRNWWSEWRCASNQMVPVTLFDRYAGVIPETLSDAYAALETALIATGYEAASAWTFNCRKIAGTDTWSLHAYGLAVDIDPGDNPYTPGDPFSGKFTQEQVEAVEAIRTLEGNQPWSWGGRWGTPDRMHWQINIPQTDTEIDWVTVKGAEVPHEHTPPAGQIHDWADNAWDEWVAYSNTDPNSRGWNFQREDMSWVYTRVLKDFEQRIAALEANQGTEGIPSGAAVLISGQITQTT